MNRMIINGQYAPADSDQDRLIECYNCCNELNDCERADPCEIEGHTFCDHCASDLVLLRMGDVLRRVSDRTRELKYDKLDNNY